MQNSISCIIGSITNKFQNYKRLFLPQLPKQAQLPKREASTTCLSYALYLNIRAENGIFAQKTVFSPNVELEGIARQVVEASHLGSNACFGITEAEIGEVIFLIFFFVNYPTV